MSRPTLTASTWKVTATFRRRCSMRGKVGSAARRLTRERFDDDACDRTGEYVTATVTPLPSRGTDGHTDGSGRQGLAQRTLVRATVRARDEVECRNRGQQRDQERRKQPTHDDLSIRLWRAGELSSGDMAPEEGIEPTLSQGEPRCPNSVPACRCSRCPWPASTNRSARADRHEAPCPRPRLLLHLGRDGPTPVSILSNAVPPEMWRVVAVNENVNRVRSNNSLK